MSSILLFLFFVFICLLNDGVAFVVIPIKTGAILSREGGSVCHLAAGGGFGGSSSTGSANKKSTKKTNKKKKKKSILTSSLMMEETTTDPKNEEVKLDRFGLPLPTMDSIFPPMPPDTELIPSSANNNMNLKEIQTYMSKHISLNWDIFDSHGIEKTSNNNHPWKLKLLHVSPPGT